MLSRIAALLLALLAVPALASTYQRYVKDIGKMQEAAWILACRLKSYDCSQLTPPQVWYFPLGSIHGRYAHGEVGIEVDTDLLGQAFSGLVMVHEMVHYIQYHQRVTGESGTMLLTSCQREAEAFNITNAVAIASGLHTDPRVATWLDMDWRYGCVPNQRRKDVK